MKQYLMILTFLAFAIQRVFAGVENTPAQTNETYVIRPGDNLDSIATLKYGNRCFSALLALHNEIEASRKLKPGQKIRTPDLKTLLIMEKLVPMMEKEVDAMLKARSLFRGVVSKLDESREGKKQVKVQIPADVKTALISAEGNIDTAIAGLKLKKDGVGAIPEKMIGQLKSVSQNLKELSTGSYDGYGYDMDLVEQHLAHAMLNGIKWARNGYK